MGAVGVKVASAVRAQHFDRLLRGDRAAKEGLSPSVKRGPRSRAGPCLNYALGNEEESIDNADGQEHIEVHSDKIDPEIANFVRLSAGNASYNGDCDSDPDAGRKEVVRRERDGLRHITHRRFAGVA